MTPLKADPLKVGDTVVVSDYGEIRGALDSSTLSFHSWLDDEHTVFQIFVDRVETTLTVTQMVDFMAGFTRSMKALDSVKKPGHKENISWADASSHRYKDKFVFVIGGDKMANRFQKFVVIKFADGTRRDGRDNKVIILDAGRQEELKQILGKIYGKNEAELLKDLPK